MKVLCIDDKDRPDEKINGLKIYEGEIYTVEYTTKARGTNGSYVWSYKLFGLNDPDGWDAFAVDRFIPLSDIDETEFERNYNKEKL